MNVDFFIENILKEKGPFNHYDHYFNNEEWSSDTFDDVIVVVGIENNIAAVQYLFEQYSNLNYKISNSIILHDYLQYIIDWNTSSKKQLDVNLEFIDLSITKGVDLNLLKKERTILDVAIDNQIHILIKHLMENYNPVAHKNSWLIKTSKFKKRYMPR